MTAASTAPGRLAALDEQIRELRDLVVAQHAEAFGQVPVERYLAGLGAWPTGRAYHRPPDDVARMAQSLKSLGGVPLLAAYHRLTLALLSRRALATGPAGPPCDRNWSGIVRVLDAIVESLGTTPDSRLTWGHDEFQKDVNVACLRVGVAGPRILEVRSGISRRMMIEGGVRQLPRVLLQLVRMGGRTPLYEGHLYHRVMSEFGPEGNVAYWRACAELMSADPGVRGGFAGSWYYDPALESISPHLRYLRELPLAHGGFLIEIPASKSMVRSALMKSDTRRQLHAQGRYTPRAHLIVWPRRPLLAWARSAA